MPKTNSRRLDKNEKNVLLHLLQAPKLTNGDIAKIIDVDERTISRRRKQLRTLGHLSPERNVKGAEKLRPWHLERTIALLEENNDLQLKDVQEFLKREFDLHVTVSTISRQLSRANYARAKRPGYKGTRPDLHVEQPPPEEPQPQLQAQQLQSPNELPPSQLPQQQGEEEEAQEQHAQSSITPGQQQSAAPIQVVDDALQPVVATSQQLQQLQQQQQQHTIPPVSPTLKLACPFYKRNPQRYADGPFCQGQWPTSRDVKEHVYRQHMVPKFRCNRCMENFQDNTGLVLHQRAAEPCSLGEWVTPEGCDEEQKEKIRRGDRGDETERWKRMFRILFPEAEENVIPSALVEESPYFNTAIDPSLGPWQGPASQAEQDMI